MTLRKTTLGRITGAGLALALAGSFAPAAAAAPSYGVGQPRGDLGRQVLATNDGWASAEGGTTGGAAASRDHVYHVETWAEFQAALGGSDARELTEPRIIYVHGELNAWERVDGSIATCESFADAVDFSQDAYIAAFDADTWEWRITQEELTDLQNLQDAAASEQARQTQQHVPSNTTIIGVGDDARIVGANLRIREVENVIVRNLTLSDSTDCFPEWDPGDTSAGNWNSRYDNLSLWTAKHVWIDHNTFDSGDMPPDALESVFGRPYEVHDGLLDITHSSDLVTVSYNRFEPHDKTMLIGSSDGRTADRGTLRVTLHHNMWTDIGQRAPRVRYGQVDVYNNYYVQTDDYEWFSYYWGVGRESAIYAENNYFELHPANSAADIIADWRRDDAIDADTGMTEIGTRVNNKKVSALDAYNAANPDDQIPTDAGWVPTYRLKVDPTMSVPAQVRLRAGAGVLR